MTGAAITIEVRLAKSVLENEEGMNHLWVHLEPLGGGSKRYLNCSFHQGSIGTGKQRAIHRIPVAESLLSSPKYQMTFY